MPRPLWGEALETVAASGGGARTLEVRWIRRGALPPAMIDRFGPFGEEIEQREDRYLVEPLLPGLGVKIRDTIELDLKMYLGSPGALTVPRAAGGLLEIWEKWTYPLQADDLPHADVSSWIPVLKVRRRRSFGFADRAVERPLSEAASPGCSVELTEVRIGDEMWWTLGLEAGGPAETLERDLYATVDHVFHGPLPGGLELDPQDSMSYTRWLGLQRALR